VTVTNYGFDKQLARVYTRNVYQEFKRRFKAGTAFPVWIHPDKSDYYLVAHTRPPTDFPWLQHEYWVKAVVNEEMPELSVFSCECMRVEHTGEEKVFSTSCWQLNFAEFLTYLNDNYWVTYILQTKKCLFFLKCRDVLPAFDCCLCYHAS
jgi:hypothetical protein